MPIHVKPDVAVIVLITDQHFIRSRPIDIPGLEVIPIVPLRDRLPPIVNEHRRHSVNGPLDDAASPS